MNCPLCNTKMEFSEVMTEESPDHCEFPATVYEYWCEHGHLTVAESGLGGAGFTSYILNSTGDELYQIEMDTRGNIQKLVDRYDGGEVWSC